MPARRDVCPRRLRVVAVKVRNSPIQSWFLDLGLMLGYWDGEGARPYYHHTAPVNALYGLHESLSRLLGEGLEAASGAPPRRP
nr:hypothetical protein [Ensifer aridi]